VDDLFSQPEQQQGQDVIYITSRAVSRDGSTAVVAVCVRRYCGGLGLPHPDSAATFHASNDGGVTWREESGDGMVRVLAITPEGQLRGRWWNDEEVRLGRRAVIRPAGADGVLYSSRTIGQALWSSGNQVVDANGKEIVQVEQAESIRDLFAAAEGTPIVGWYADDQADGYLLTRRQPSGEHVGFRYEGYFLSGVHFDDDRFFADITAGEALLGRSPALVDFATGVISPLEGIADELKRGRNSVLAAYRGPFLRVEAPPDGCLNLHEAADETSPVIDCLASKVLVRDLLRGTGTATQQWHEVETLDGRRGWAELQYLKGD
jgi:hypothetical protein